MKTAVNNNTLLSKLKSFEGLLNNKAQSLECVEYSPALYDEYVKICRACIPDFSFPQYQLKNQKYFESFTNRINNKFLFLKINEEYVGCASVKKLNDHCYYFGDLKIIPKYRCLGLAEKLFFERIKRIKQKSYYIILSTVDGKLRIRRYLDKLERKGIKFEPLKNMYILTDFPLAKKVNYDLKNTIYDKELNKEVHLAKSTFLKRMWFKVIKAFFIFSDTKINAIKPNQKVKITHTNLIKDNCELNKKIQALRSYASQNNSDLMVAYSTFYPVCSTTSMLSSVTKMNYSFYRHNYSGKISIPMDMVRI